VLIATTYGKRLFGRKRPRVPPIAKRSIDLRTKEINGSLPSGDTAQAALLVFFLKYNYPYCYAVMGSEIFALKFMALIAFARVFHHCHYFGDTIVGMILGFTVATLYHTFEIRIPTPF
jgi:membrane-associated phospholipid phosphatase